jgi:hypothetical protein
MGKAQGKKAISILIAEDLFDRVEAWRSDQTVPVNKTAVYETAIREFLESREGKKKKPAG